MSEQYSNTPNITIIKRKRARKEEQHHGGAWKVAYADFVTAMMAFFLLMWLLNATTEDQRKGISDYFSPTIPISRISGGGSDGLNGSSIFSEETLSKMGTGASRKVTDATSSAESGPPALASKSEIASSLDKLKQGLELADSQISEHLQVKVSAEGIVLEVTDSEQAPLFAVGRSEPSSVLVELLGHVAGSVDGFENHIKIVGHTDSRGYRRGAGYDNWNLSADRANIARKLLVENGVPTERISEVSGKADSDPLVLSDPLAAQNRRISITVLTQ